MLDMNQTTLGDALGITFQQIHKYETGANRIGAGRLHHISQILQVPPTFFFEDDMPAEGDSKRMNASPNTIMNFMSTSEGLALAKAFMKIRSMESAAEDCIEWMTSTAQDASHQPRSC